MELGRRENLTRMLFLSLGLRLVRARGAAAARRSSRMDLLLQLVDLVFEILDYELVSLALLLLLNSVLVIFDVRHTHVGREERLVTYTRY